MDPGSLVLSHLADSSVRALSLAAVALAALWLGRVRSVSVRHAVWTVTLGAMLLLPCMITLLPDLPLRILPTWQAAPQGQEVLTSGREFVSTGAVADKGGQFGHSWPTWQQVGLAVYGAGLLVMLGRLLLSCLLVRRLVRSCVPVRDARATALLERYGGGSPPALVESPGIWVPMTTGSFTPRILLPSGWRAWGDVKLEASLVHELAHVRRRDPLIALMAALNTCLFWFHPLAWWLERRLALLAEQAADDSTLLAIHDRRQYASALLDMASAAGAGQRRLLWEAVAMARPSQLRRRIDRVLDESIRLSHGLSKGRWLALSLFGVVALCCMSALQLEAVPQRVLNELSGPYGRWLREDVVYIISDEERSTFLRLTTAEEQEAFIEQFWRRRDPTPGTARNEFKEEHYRRITYANERFPTSSQPGWRSDRGRVYTTFGPPDENESHPAGDGTSPPYEIWRYRWIEDVGEKVELTFYDPERTGEYRLLPEALVNRVEQYARAEALAAGSPSATVAATSSWFTCSVSVFGRSSTYKPSFFAQIGLVLDRTQLQFQPRAGSERAIVNVYGRVTSAEGRPVTVFEDVMTLERPSGVPSGQSLYAKLIALDPGSYRLSVRVREAATGRTESQELSFTVPAVQ